jgi:hypothetical protein
VNYKQAISQYSSQAYRIDTHAEVLDAGAVGVVEGLVVEVETTEVVGSTCVVTEPVTPESVIVLLPMMTTDDGDAVGIDVELSGVVLPETVGVVTAEAEVTL